MFYYSLVSLGHTHINKSKFRESIIVHSTPQGYLFLRNAIYYRLNHSDNKSFTAKININYKNNSVLEFRYSCKIESQNLEKC